MPASSPGRMCMPASPPPEELREAPSALMPRSGLPSPSTPWAAGSDWSRSSCISLISLETASYPLWSKHYDFRAAGRR